MRNLIKISLLAIIGIVGFIGCKEKEDLSEQKEAIIGTWVQIEPSCIPSNCDTVVVDVNMITSIYFIGEKHFEVLSNESILIGNEEYYFQLRENNSVLFIENFIILDFGILKEDILLRKIL